MDEVIAKLGATKAFIITGQSLSTRTPVIKEAEASLGSAHVGTFNKIGQHAYDISILHLKPRVILIIPGTGQLELSVKQQS